MFWTSFIMGGMSVIFAYALFSSGSEETEQDEAQDDPENIMINGRKFYQLSCQTCRKIKNHREIEPRIFECVKCNRRTNLNAS